MTVCENCGLQQDSVYAVSPRRAAEDIMTVTTQGSLQTSIMRSCSEESPRKPRSGRIHPARPSASAAPGYEEKNTDRDLPKQYI